MFNVIFSETFEKNKATASVAILSSANEVNPSANGNVVGVWLRSPPAYGLGVVEGTGVFIAAGIHVVNFLINKRLWR